MFFTPKLYRQLSDKGVCLSDNCDIIFPSGFYSEYICKMLKSSSLQSCRADFVCAHTVSFSLGIPENICSCIAERISANAEEFCIVIGEKINIYSREERGFFYALSALLDISGSDGLRESIVYDYPLCPIRGYRVYMPGRENIAVFKKMIDFLARYRFNSIILEIGGAMEYKRHPEINTAWVNFCRDMSEYSGKYADVQRKYSYKKNSVHIENGDGSYLTQDECRDIAEYCRERGLEVIPECPTLSHSDYLLLPHPEFCERENDEIPDTYCPNHPDIYRYVFDVLDEVIDVFRPSKINIGHDEFYSMCICERCKGLDPIDVYIKDIEKLAAYLKSKGIETLMWAEKLLKAVGPKGQHYGGWYDEKLYHDGTRFKVPDFYECASRMPRDVIYLHWYWIFGEHLDRVYHDNGYRMVFGNFSAIDCDNFRERIAWGSMGGFVSNWGSNEEEYMQRNCQYYSLMTTAYALWCHDYDDSRRSWLDRRVMEENYRRNFMNLKNPITVLHTTDRCDEYKQFWCGLFIEDDKLILGHYKACYSDGTTALFSVKYGTNITNMYVGGDFSDELADKCGSDSYREVSGGALPKIINGKFYFETKYENPYPEKILESMAYVPKEEMSEYNVETLEAQWENRIMKLKNA